MITTSKAYYIIQRTSDINVHLKKTVFISAFEDIIHVSFESSSYQIIESSALQCLPFSDYALCQGFLQCLN